MDQNWHLLTLIPHDMISFHVVEGFQWNSVQIMSMCAAIAEKVFNVRGHMSRS